MLRLALAAWIVWLPIASFAADSDVAASAQEVEPLEVGAPIPDVELKTPDGKSVALSSLTGKKPVVLVFYRGGW